MALLPTSAQDLITRLPFVAQTGPDTRSQLVQALTGAINQGREQKVAQQLGAATTAAVSGTATDEQLGLLFQRDPAAALKVLEGAGAVSAQGRDRLAQTAFSIQGLQPDQQTAAIQQVVQQIQQSGGDPSAWVNMLQGSPEQRDEALRGIQQASLSVKQRGEIGEADRQFSLDTAKFRLDERNIRSQIAARGRPTIPAKTSIEKNLIAAGLKPGTPEFQAQILSFIQKPVGTTVTIGDQRTLAKATEGQLASAGFADRMNNANADLGALSSGGFDPTSLTATLLVEQAGLQVWMSLHQTHHHQRQLV